MCSSVEICLGGVLIANGPRRGHRSSETSLSNNKPGFAELLAFVAIMSCDMALWVFPGSRVGLV